MTEEDIRCPECRGRMDVVDSTISNIGPTKGQHTGDIYYCKECQTYLVYIFATRQMKEWTY